MTVMNIITQSPMHCITVLHNIDDRTFKALLMTLTTKFIATFNSNK